MIDLTADKHRKYIFEVNGRPKAPIRDTWEEAAEDAFQCRYGRWVNKHEFKIDTDRGATIRALR